MDHLDAVIKLINHNGGWWIMGSDVPYAIGHIGVHKGIHLVIIGFAEHKDSLADCAVLGLPCLREYKYNYKVTTD